VHVPPPRDATEGQLKTHERLRTIRRMEYALEAANAAGALIAELEAREEFDPLAPPETVEELVRRGVAAGGTILTCKHGRASYEPCEQCDAEDAAGKTGKTGGESSDPA